MGVLSSKSTLKQALVIGPEGSGKTTLIYKVALKRVSRPWTATTTRGFNYEELENDREQRIALWDMGGSVSVSKAIRQTLERAHLANRIQRSQDLLPSVRPEDETRS